MAVAQTPPPESAEPQDNFSCRGHTAKAEDSTADAPRLQYSFGCSSKIIGYFLVFDQEVRGFEAEVPVRDVKGEVTSEQFACEGVIPASGFGCFGTYAAGGRSVVSHVDLDRDVCVEPRVGTRLIVVTSAKGNTAGPFDLGRPQGCPKSSRLKGLRALIELLKDELREARRK
jgi:hypothetical protein